MVKDFEQKPEGKKSSVIGKFTGKCCDSNVINNNDMHLGRDVFEKLIASEEFQRAMQNRHYIGFLGHPDNADCQDFEHACIVMTDLRILGNGEIEGDFDLVDTPVGRVVKSFTDAGVKFGISIRGVGEVDGNGEVDPDEFIFRGFDLVTFPAYDDCIPEFKEIAASTDAAKKSKYKKICASIDANLKDITSCEALALIQEQLPTGSEEFGKIQSRIDELENPDEVVDECAIIEEVNKQRLEAVTQLYLDAVAKVKELECQLAECQCAKQDLIVECTSLKHRQTRMDKIVAAQIEDANAAVEESNKELEDVKASLSSTRNELRNTKRELFASKKSFGEDIKAVKQELVESKQLYNDEVLANARLKEKLTSLTEKRKDDREAVKASEDLNLKYQHKIEANSKAISQKDSEIEDLKNKLNETVIASKDLEAKASNLDEQNGELLSRVEAAEEMVSKYQQAYANLYANALGVYLKGLPVTASTSVDELKQMINSGTSTANIPARPAFYSVEEEEQEDDQVIEGEDFDDTQYSADMVTL